MFLGLRLSLPDGRTTPDCGLGQARDFGWAGLEWSTRGLRSGKTNPSFQVWFRVGSSMMLLSGFLADTLWSSPGLR